MLHFVLSARLLLNRLAEQTMVVKNTERFVSVRCACDSLAEKGPWTVTADGLKKAYILPSVDARGPSDYTAVWLPIDALRIDTQLEAMLGVSPLAPFILQQMGCIWSCSLVRPAAAGPSHDYKLDTYL